MPPGAMMGGIPPVSMVVGTSAQPLGMMPPMMGPAGMQPTHMVPQMPGMGMPPTGTSLPVQRPTQTSMAQPAGMMMQPGMMPPANMAPQMSGIGMPPTGTSLPRHGQPQMSMTQPVGMVVQPGMTQPGIMQPGHVASMPVQMGPVPNQHMPPPCTTETDDTAAHGRDESGTSLASGIPHAGTVQSHAWPGQSGNTATGDWSAARLGGSGQEHTGRTAAPRFDAVHTPRESNDRHSLSPER